MGQKSVIIILALLWANPVLAQIYKDKYDVSVAPMERAIEHSDKEFGDVPIAGAIEDDKPIAQRYEENVGVMDQVTDKHFIVAVDNKIPDKDETNP
ncbi:MAG: hypothetical protein HQL21_00470 [Candidatus Omnitrophica bacterium]|nr:hypothetical protein [Candidatus Omnitrophota bacterium]